MFANIAFNLAIDDLYTYSVPPELQTLLECGMLVEAPLGRRREIGCVVSLTGQAPDLGGRRIRPILKRVSPDYRIPGELMELARFVSNYYFCGPGEALAAVSSVGFQDIHLKRPVNFRLAGDWRARAGELVKPLTKKQRAMCEVLEEAGFPALPKGKLAERAGCGPAIVRRLEEAGLIELDEEPPPYLDPVSLDTAPSLEPTGEQREALDAVNAAIDEERFSVFLLHGVTGSGKTEVYLQSIHRVLARGSTALCLLPEISLTPQTVERFETRFRQEVGVFHSQLSKQSKLLLYRRIQSGNIRMVIGARSAVFAPLPDLGLIVVDEEHDGSFKQSETPRYHARDVAIVRAQRLGIPVLLGSATPSVESYANARNGKYVLLRLSERAGGVGMPSVRLIDLGKQVAGKALPTLFSEALVDAIRDRIEKGEQTLLFLNRRGFSNFLFCPSCKWTARCEEDDVALTVHRKRPRHPGGDETQGDLFIDSEPGEFFLRCHFCGVTSDAPEKCPQCANEALMTIGSGTQRVEEELALHFPDARLIRMDHDTAGGRSKFLKAWNRILSGEVDIILGTQMIAKGLHLERVTLVGVVLADIGLFLPDFRAEERTFQLLTQVAGRSGRTGSGEVLLQTYLPRQSAVRFAVEHDTEGFFEEELLRRRKLGFPPFNRLAAITVSDPDRERAYGAARQLGYLLSRLRSQRGCQGVRVNGPTVAPIARLAGRHRYRILLKSESITRIGRLLRLAFARPEWHPPQSVRTAVDIDPVDLL